MNRPILIFFLCPLLIFGQVDKPYTASYIVEWANDTIAIETFTLHKNHLFGKVIQGFPENYVRHYDITFNEDWSIRDLDYQYFEVANTSIPLKSVTGLPYRFTASVNNGLVDYTILNEPKKPEELQDRQTGKVIERIILESENFHFNGDWIPIIGQFEAMAAMLTTNGQDKIEGLKFINAYIGIHDLQLERISANHIEFWSNISEAIHIYLNKENRIDSINAIGSVWNVKIHKTNPLDIEDFTKKFKNRPVIGNPSPPETISQNINGTAIEINYGRPSVRGRKIFGNIVPYGQIWRTGAGAATTITFDNDIYFDGTKVPAGKYNVYSRPTSDSFTLILNSKLDAWGSVHLPEYDVIHIPMTLTRNYDSMEKFTIEINTSGKGGELRFRWENLIANIDFFTN